MTTTELTHRQEQIKAYLEQGKSAREIGSELGISRNAVYQQIQALRRKGALDPAFTPSGAPAREPGVSDGHGGPEPLVVQQTRLILDHVRDLRRLADELERSVS